MKFKYVLMACAALVLGATSCSKEEGKVTPPEEEGKAIVKIRMVDSSEDGASTRAYGDYPATDAEKKINNALVYMFNSSRALVKIIPLENNAGNWEKVFEATPGEHYFIATANAPVVDVPNGTGLDYLSMKIDNLVDEVAFKGIITDDNFFMTTPVFVETVPSANDYKRMEYRKQTLVAATEADIKAGTPTAPASNIVTIPVGRAMAKANLTIPATAYKVQHATYGEVGSISDVKYRPANNTYMMYHFPYFGTAQLFQTPLFDKAPRDSKAIGYWPELHSANFFTDAVAGSASEYYNAKVPSLVRPSGAAATPDAFYVMENSNTDPTWSNATVLQVKAKFTPKTDVAVDGLTPDGAITGTFYRVWDNDSRDFLKGYYASSATADAAAAAKVLTDYEVLTYEGGYCYYLIPIRDTDRGNSPACHDVVRNHFYDIQINKITDCGYSEPGGGPGPGDETEPEDPLYPDDYFVKVEIIVKKWTHVREDEETGIGYEPKF